MVFATPHQIYRLYFLIRVNNLNWKKKKAARHKRRKWKEIMQAYEIDVLYWSIKIQLYLIIMQLHFT